MNIKEDDNNRLRIKVRDLEAELNKKERLLIAFREKKEQEIIAEDLPKQQKDVCLIIW